MKLSGEWKKLNSAIYESKYGDRIHTGGMIKMASGHEIFLSYILADLAISKYIDMQGSRKRGMMLFTEIAKPEEVLRISKKNSHLVF